MAHDISRNWVFFQDTAAVAVSDERSSNLLLQVDKRSQWPADKQICALYENFESLKLKQSRK